MEKPATTRFDVLPAIRQRYSTVAFRTTVVPREVLGSVFEAARWAASSYNDQPWSFVVATQEQPAEYARLLGCLMEANQVWAKQAPVLVLTIASLIGKRTGKPNRHAYHDLGMATAQLMMQATACGLQSHPMGGFDVAKARVEFGIPETHDPVAMLALGYVAEPDSLPGDLKDRELAARSRKALNEIAFGGMFGKAFGL